MGFEPTPSFEDQNAHFTEAKSISLESGALDRSAILTCLPKLHFQQNKLIFWNFKLWHFKGLSRSACSNSKMKPCLSLQSSFRALSLRRHGALQNYTISKFKFRKKIWFVCLGLLCSVTKGTSINDVPRFLAIFDLPTYLVLLYNVRFLGLSWTPLLTYRAYLL